MHVRDYPVYVSRGICAQVVHSDLGFVYAGYVMLHRVGGARGEHSAFFVCMDVL